MATPLVDWDKLVVPSACVWVAENYGFVAPAAEATQRATALLLAHLNEQQRADYQRIQRFAVLGASGVVYVMGLRLYPTSIVEGRAHQRFCAPPARFHYAGGDSCRIPMEDLLLTWKLFVEGAEAEFLTIAR